MAKIDVKEEIRGLLGNRDQIMFYATSGYSDGRSSEDGRRLDQIAEQLAEFGITDENMTLDQFDEDVERGLFKVPEQKSIAGSMFDKVTSWFGGGEKQPSKFEERLARISAENTHDHD